LSLPKFSVNRRVTVSMLILILVLFGVFSFTRLGLDMMPEIEYPTLVVITTYPGASAEDVERLITVPVEGAVSAIKGIEKMTSTSYESQSAVTVNFKWGADLNLAAQDIRENLDRARGLLPADISDPVIHKFDMSQMPILMYGVSGMDSPMELQKFLRDVIAPRVEGLEGVATMRAVGGPEREINVFLNKTRLDQYGIGPEAVVNALAQANVNIPNGYLNVGRREFLVRTVGEFNDLNTIAGTIIAVPGGTPVRISDVGRVADTERDVRNYVRLNGKDAVLMQVTKQSGANTLETVRKVRELLEKLKTGVAANIEFIPISDQGEAVENVTNDATGSALVGAILAVLILWAFLRNWRPTFVIALAIPISIITTFIGLYAFGYTLNMITIAGFALAAGMLIDNSVVVIENIYRHLESGEHRNDAAIKGAQEVGLAISASTLTTIAVFVPLSLAGGFAGKIAQPLALTVSAGLAASLLVAITIVPMFASVIFKKRAGKNLSAEASGGKLFRGLQNGYGGMLGWALKHRVIVVLFTLCVFGSSMYGMTLLGAEFMPEGDSGEGSVSIKMPIGANLAETNSFVRVIEEKIISIPEVKNVCLLIGGIGGGGDVGEAQIYFKLNPLDERGRTTKQVVEEIRQSMPKVYDIAISFPGAGGGGGSGAPIEIKFFGSDLRALEVYANSAKAIIGKFEGLRDVSVSASEGKPELRIIPDRDKAAMMGFTVSDVGLGIMYANMGVVATKYRSGGEELDVRVRLEEQGRATLEEFTSIPLISRSGISTPIMNIGRIVPKRGPVSIYREERVPSVSVSAKIAGRDIQGEMTKIQAALKEMEAAMPDGYRIDYGGSYGEMQDTFMNMMIAIIVAVLLIYMIMAAQFESFTQPLIVMFTVPLAFIGVVTGLMVMGHPLSVPVFMGIIVLVGIVLNNGIVMIDCVNRLRADGLGMKEALIQGACTRLRPILITSVTTIAALLPMTLSQGQGSEMQSPLGTAVAFGLASSTLLTLFVVPVFYSIIAGIASWAARILAKIVLGEDTAQA